MKVKNYWPCQEKGPVYSNKEVKVDGCAKHQGQPIWTKLLKGRLEWINEFLRGKINQWMKTKLSSGDDKAVTTAYWKWKRNINVGRKLRFQNVWMKCTIGQPPWRPETGLCAYWSQTTSGRCPYKQYHQKSSSRLASGLLSFRRSKRKLL